METKEKSNLVVQGFYGTVVLKDWLRWGDDKQYLGFYGRIYIYQDKEVVGFTVRGNDSNWIARIQGATSSVNVMGCQVRGIITSNQEPDADGGYKKIP
jgi:hypothetical protein